MIPMVAVMALRIEPKGRRWWIPLPLFLVWLILLPLAIVWVPLVILVCAVVDVDPFQAMGTTWQVLAGLRELRLDVETREADVRLTFI
jgi:uncharacterized membrane protein